MQQNGSLVVLTDQITKAQILADYLRSADTECGVSASDLFIALQRFNVNLYTDKFLDKTRFSHKSSLSDDECQVNVRLYKGRGITTLLNMRFVEIIINSTARMLLMSRIGWDERTDTTLEQCRSFVNIFVETVLCLSSQPKIDFKESGTGVASVPASFKKILTTKSAAVSSMHIEDLRLWEMDSTADDQDFINILNRLLLSGQSAAINTLYKLFLEIMEYCIVNIFTRRFKDTVSVTHTFQTAECNITVKCKRDVFSNTFYNFMTDIGADPLLAHYVTDVDLIVRDNAVQNGDAAVLIACCKEDKSVNGLCLAAVNNCSLLKDTLRGAEKSVFMMDGSLIRQHAGYAELLRTYTQNTKKLRGIYSIRDSKEYRYSDATDIIYGCFGCESELGLANRLGYVTYDDRSNDIIGKSIIRVFDEMTTTDNTQLLSHCAGIGNDLNSVLSIMYGTDTTEPIQFINSLKIQGSLDKKPDQHVEYEPVDLYSRDKFGNEYDSQMLLSDVDGRSLKEHDAAVYFRELFNRGVRNLGGINVEASSFDAGTEQFKNLNIKDYIKRIVREASGSPAAVSGCDLYLNVTAHTGTQAEGLAEFYLNTFIPDYSLLWGGARNLMSWLDVTYRTKMRTEEMKPVRKSVETDINLLRMLFAKDYIKYIKSSEPMMIIDQLISFVHGDAVYDIKTIAENTLAKVMINSKSNPRSVLRAFGRLDHYETDENQRALIFVEDEVYINRLKEFDPWVNVLGTEVGDNINHSLGFDVTGLFNKTYASKRVSRSDEYLENSNETERLGNNFSNEALVDKLLSSLYAICGTSVGETRGDDN